MRDRDVANTHRLTAGLTGVLLIGAVSGLPTLCGSEVQWVWVTYEDGRVTDRLGGVADEGALAITPVHVRAADGDFFGEIAILGGGRRTHLAAFLRALAHGQLLSASTFPEMTKGLPETGHSLGVFASDPPSATGISNSGALPGFTAYMQYDPATRDLLVLMLNDHTRSPEQLGTTLSEITAEL